MSKLEDFWCSVYEYGDDPDTDLSAAERADEAVAEYRKRFGSAAKSFDSVELSWSTVRRARHGWFILEDPDDGETIALTKEDIEKLSEFL